MALHRDIFWVGRQWAVTGLGLQAVDQKQKSKFDIEIPRLWDEDLATGLSAERWFNAEDFSKGLAIARARYPQMPSETATAQPEPARAAPLEPEPSRGPGAGNQAPLSAPQFPPVAAAAPVPEVAPGKSVAAPAEPSVDTWAGLAELVTSAGSARSRKPLSPEPAASPRPYAVVAPDQSELQLDPVHSAAPVIEPPQRACLRFDMRIESSGAKFSRMWRVRLPR